MVQLRGTARPVLYLRQNNHYQPHHHHHHHHHNHHHHRHHHHHHVNNHHRHHHNYNENQQQRCRVKRKPPPRILLIILLTLWLPALNGPGGVLACGPGRGSGRRPILRKLTPLVFKQHVPNVSENTLPASGLAEGRVSRHDSRFRDLVPNYNADIIFKDEEGTGADRLMTQRCKEKLNTLAISVMNQWPGVKLRVTEGWDEEGKHATDSLHYEGRAVDVTTSDRDRSKYGMLARLAVEAGFDWVYYESRSHIHCSVKSESSSMGKSGGCFPGNSLIRSSEGEEKPLSEVKIGERIAALDTNGNIVYSEVIAFLDRSPEEKRQFVTFTTSSGRQLTLTPAHLIPVVSNNHQSSEIIFAERVKIGDRILIQDSNISNEIGGFRLRWDSVIDIKLTLENGVYAPLTREGTVLVNDVVASCYAIVDSQTIAHYAFMPFRFFCSVRSSLESASKFIWPATIFAISEKLNSVETNEIDESPEDRRLKPHGVHWYASFLFTLASYVLPTSYLY